MKSIFQTLLKSLLVGLTYAALRALTDLLLGRGVSAPFLIWSFAGGTLIGLTLGLLAASLAAAWSRQMLVWGSVVFFNIASVTIEGRFFAPDLVRGPMIVLLLQQLLVALLVTWLIVRLFAPGAESTPPAAMQRSWFSWLWRFVLSALAYLIFYYFFGAINYLLVTGPYYETHAGGLVVPGQQVLLKAELVRAPMIILSILLFLLYYRADTRRKAFLAGMLLFTVGGVAPLLMQVNALPLVLLAASAVEIFCQNYFTGVAAAHLLGRPISSSWASSAVSG